MLITIHLQLLHCVLIIRNLDIFTDGVNDQLVNITEIQPIVMDLISFNNSSFSIDTNVQQIEWITHFLC